MKCVKSPTGMINRVTDEDAKAILESGWVYCPKAEYKKLHRAPKKLAITAKPVGASMASEPNVGGDSFPKKGKTSKYKQKQQAKDAQAGV